MVLHVRCRSASRRRGLGQGVWLCAALLAASFPSVAAAAGLRYEAPSECPSAATMQEEVEHLLGSALADAAEVVVRVQITHAPKDAWRVVLTVHDEGQAEPRTRVISGHSCAEVADAAALAAAITIRGRDPEPDRADSAASAAGVEPSTPSELASDTGKARSQAAPPDA